MNTITAIPITKARVNLGAVVAGVYKTGKPVVLEKGGIPAATIVSIEAFEDMHDALDIMRARVATHKEPLLDWKKIRARYV